MKRVLAIGAHPDDIEIGCGGTLALLREQGYELVHVVVTSGEEGARRGSKEDLARVREAEAEKAARILGASEIHFLREPDGLTSYSKEARMRLASLVREQRPEVLFTHSKADPFPDHQLVHDLTLSAVLAAGSPWYPELRPGPYRVPRVYGYEVWSPIPNPSLSLDISATLARKLEALGEHRSQIGEVDYLGAVSGLARYRGVTTMVGEYAEVFEVLREAGIGNARSRDA